MSKLAERILYGQLVEYVEQNEVLPPEQHGFRAKRSVETALVCLLARAAQHVDRKLKVSIAAFDFSAAFDTVDSETFLTGLKWMENQSKCLMGLYMTGGVQQVKWNESVSYPLPIQFGVRQGSVLGPLLFIILTSKLPKTVLNGLLTAANIILYADDTSSVIASKDWSTTNAAIDQISEGMALFSKKAGLHLNSNKTQVLRIGGQGSTNNSKLKLLGVTVNNKLRFDEHHADMARNLRRCVGAVRRLATGMSRGPLLCEVGRALVVGKAQCAAWVTRSVRLNRKLDDKPPTDACQVALNDLARVLLGKKRSDCINCAKLAEKAKLPTINEIVTKQAAMAAWKSLNGADGSSLASLLEPQDSRTRGGIAGLVNPTSARCIAVTNMANVWNASEALRSAKTIAEAKKCANDLAKSVRTF